ncbi:hypothetical protein IAT38_007735 [Cryptococcus sp. DSM 104549]
MPPRVPYEQHRAQKAVARDLMYRKHRGGSVAESETDAESIFSNTTYQSHTSSPYLRASNPYLDPSGRSTSFSPSYPPSPHGQSSSRERSSSPYLHTGYQSAQGGRSGSFSSFPSSGPGIDGVSALGLHGQHLGPPGVDPAKAERREKRRKQREERSTLVGDRYGSPLRQWIRWTGRKGWGIWGLPIGLLGVAIFKLCLNMSVKKGSGWIFEDGWLAGVVDELDWWAAVGWWVTVEGLRGGRSFRSQLTGIMTILLAPSLFPKSHQPFLTLTIWALLLFTHGWDATGLAMVAMSTCLDNQIWPYGLVAGAYLAGKSIWTGGPSLGLQLLQITAIPLVMAHFGQLLCWVNRSFDAIVEKAIAFMPELQSQVFVGTSIAASLPPIAILLYSSYSLRPSATTPKPASHAAPIINLVPLTLFIASIPPFLFSQTPGDVVIPLLPLALVMALRGGSAKGSEGAGTEDEVWRWGVWLHNVGMLNVMPVSTSVREIVVGTIAAAMWSTHIGADNAVIPAVARLSVKLFIYPLVSPHVAGLLEKAEAVSIKVVFSASWLWGMKKLIETAWAMGGLSGRGGGGSGDAKRKSRGKGKAA